MKTKNIVLVGIAVCAISLLLISPVLANEDEYVLGIYGNANEDDTIDMRDFTFTARVILWLEDETDLADANFDGDVNVLDMTQIGLIILGRESELTVIDILDRIVTLNMPIERVVVTEDKIGEVIRVLGLEDTVVGIDPNMEHLDGLFPVMGDKPHVGNCMWGELDYELIAELDPDLVIIHGYYSLSQLTIEPLERIGMKVIAVDNYLGSGADDEGEPIDGRDIDLTADSMVHCFRTLGIIFNRDEKAQEFLDWRTTKLEMIMERTEDLEEGEMLDAFLGFTFYPITLTRFTGHTR
jgi:iron complex transport system substrate-binding protein